MGEKKAARGAGILLSIASLPSSYGIGTLGGAAFRFIDLLVDLKQKYWQLLPIGPTNYLDSPYQSSSAFAGNPYFIDLEELVYEKLLQDTEIRSLNWGNDIQHIDYAVMYQNRYSVLKRAFERFDVLGLEYQEFVEKQQYWLEDYALYAALKKKFHDREWQSWDTPARDRDEQKLAEYRIQLKDEIEYIKFCQYEFFKQWNALHKYAEKKGIQLIGDIPLYVALDSADVWSCRKSFQLKEDGTPIGVAGTPKDVFSMEGQIWGNPVYDWKQMEEDGFFWWKERIHRESELFDGIRLDHFVGTVRYYMIPNEAGATVNSGRWNRGPGRKLMEIITESAGESFIIADDIGPKNVLPAVKKVLSKAGWPVTRILMFAFEDDTANEHLPHNYENRNIVVYPGTHDNETIVGHFHDKTDYELAYLYEYLNIRTKEEIPDALIRTAYGSVADIVIIQMQDLLKLGNEARMNAPATTGANWKWRVGEATLSEERRTWIRTLAAVYRR